MKQRLETVGTPCLFASSQLFVSSRHARSMALTAPQAFCSHLWCQKRSPWPLTRRFAFELPSDRLIAGRKSLRELCGRRIYVVRSFGRARSFRQMTCGLLEKLLGDLKSSRLLLAAEDPELEVYKEHAGPWLSRIITGVKGAERQIAFLDQICAKGAAISRKFQGLQWFFIWFSYVLIGFNWLSHAFTSFQWLS